MFFKKEKDKDVKTTKHQEQVLEMFLRKNSTSTYNIIVDGSNLYMRSLMSKSYEYYNKKGQDVSVLRKSLYSFFYNIRQIVSQLEFAEHNKHPLKIDNIYVVFDRGGSVRHRELLETYKHKGVNPFAAMQINEEDEEKRQFSVFMRLLDLFPRVKVFYVPYAEGDLVASYILTKFSLKAKNIMVTGDRDYIQLLAYYPAVLMYYLARKKSTFYDLFTFNGILKYSEKVSPKEYLLMKLMIGDKSDGIPGITGIGKKKSLYLVQDLREIASSNTHPYNGEKGLKLITALLVDKYNAKQDPKEIYNILVRNFKLMNLVNFDLLSQKQKKEVENITNFDKLIGSDAKKNFAEFQNIVDAEKIKMNFDTYSFIRRLFFT